MMIPDAPNKKTPAIGRNGPSDPGSMPGAGRQSPPPAFSAPLSFERAWPLIEAACLGSIPDLQLRELQELLRGDAALQRAYLEYCRMHAELRCLCRASAANNAVLAKIASEGPPLPLCRNEGQWASGQPGLSPPSAPGFLGGLRQGTVSYLSDHTMVSGYLVATVFFAVAALVGLLVQVSHVYDLQTARTAPASDASPPRIEMEFVGRITGMAGVKWSADPRYLPPLGLAYVPLGRKYILDAGLMEITYDSGAKVILQGPCNYEVESSAGGFLALGKLTAKVVSGQWPVASAKPQAANLQISKSPNQQISNPQSLIPNPFFVRTPTAIVTDLGTEFGVEVDRSGVTQSLVFQGKVEVRLSDGWGDDRKLHLNAGESARVEKGADGPKLMKLDASHAPPKFARRLVESPKVLDLLDVVAGGSGLGCRRERGIDPSTGMEAPFFIAEHNFNVTQYKHVAWHRMIDGVFVPDGRRGAIQLDSAGHKFDGFPPTHADVFGSIWARAADVSHDERTKNSREWIYSAGEAGKYMPQRRGLLGLHSNVGITFDLEATRRTHPGSTPTNFRAVAGLADKPASPSELKETWVDVWVFVDGRLTFKRNKLHVDEGVFNIDVKLGPGDRFLTLAVTDFDMKMSGDRMIFGDPVLDMIPTESEN